MGCCGTSFYVFAETHVRGPGRGNTVNPPLLGAQGSHAGSGPSGGATMDQSGRQLGVGGWAGEGSTGQGGRELGLGQGPGLHCVEGVTASPEPAGPGPHLPLLPWLCGPRQVSEPLWAQPPVGKRDMVKPHVHCWGTLPSQDGACPSVLTLSRTQTGKP